MGMPIIAQPGGPSNSGKLKNDNSRSRERVLRDKELAKQKEMANVESELERIRVENMRDRAIAQERASDMWRHHQN